MKKKLAILCAITILGLTGCGSDEPKEPVATEAPTEAPTEVPVLSIDEIKTQATQLYHDDVFFGKEDLEGKYVKLNVMLSEKMEFTAESMYSSTLQEEKEKYHYTPRFFNGCILHEDADSYVGKSIPLYFEEGGSFSPDNYKTGDKLTVYGLVVGWGNSTWDGYNSVRVLVKCIE